MTHFAQADLEFEDFVHFDTRWEFGGAEKRQHSHHVVVVSLSVGVIDSFRQTEIVGNVGLSNL